MPLFCAFSVVPCFSQLQLSHGSNSPEKSNAPDSLPDLSALRILVAYQKALLLQAPFQQAQDAFNKGVANYNAVQEEERKANKLPEGTTFQVDVNTQTVKIVLPAPKPPEQKPGEASAPAEKPAEVKK